MLQRISCDNISTNCEKVKTSNVNMIKNNQTVTIGVRAGRSELGKAFISDNSQIFCVATSSQK